MTREDFDLMEDKLRKEYVRRQSLGGYSADAETLQFLCATVYELSRHISAGVPRTASIETPETSPSSPTPKKKLHLS